jgi:hypothetical protein
VLLNNRTIDAASSATNITTIANVTGGSNTLDAQTTAGNNSWIGHLYGWNKSALHSTATFTGFLGDYTQTETFNELFGVPAMMWHVFHL